MDVKLIGEKREPALGNAEDTGGEKMPDTGEDREIRQRVNAKEAEIVSETTKLLQKSKPAVELKGNKRRGAAVKKSKKEAIGS